jgi:23S rRNA pseudouridine1911/1915/1917 synthase
MNGERFTADAPGPLLQVLATQLPGWSRNTLRQRIELGCVDVNGLPAARGNQQVAAGDVIEVRDKGAGRTAAAAAAKLPVLYFDDDLLAVDKPAGLLAVGSEHERERTALAFARERVQHERRGADVWPAHRIDRETSGVLLFVRSRELRDAVQAAWPEVEKVYVAIVEGRPEPAAGTIEQPLWEDRNLRVRVGAHAEAKPARTRYRTVASHGARTELELRLDTGRKHQIRAHLAWLGHPVVGDDRYGTRAARLCLHAHRLVLPHPRDGRRLTIEAPVPNVLRRELEAG